MSQEHKLLTELLALFYLKDFSFQYACKVLGPLEEEEQHRIILKPFARLNLERAVLEKLTVAEEPPFLAGISASFKGPAVVDFGELAKRFGPEEEEPRLKPDGDIPYTFEVKGEDFDGYLMLDATQHSTAARRKVTRFILRRFPAERK